MMYFFLIVFAAAALLYAARPLLDSKKHMDLGDDALLSGDEEDRRLLEAKKRLILDNVSEHEFEFAMGKLSQEDFDRLRRGCENDLQAVNRAIEAFHLRRDIEDRIESEVAARRRLK